MDRDPLELPDFAAPTALPSTLARVLAFSAIIIAAVCGGLVGYAVADLQCDGPCGGLSAFAGIVGALISGFGVAVIAVLVLRAMSEWESQASVRDR